MSATRRATAEISSRTLSEISEVETVRISLDLVSAARRNIGFLRAVSESQWLHQKHVLVEAIRRYDELWMPLIADLIVGGPPQPPPMVVPPFDIEWVWFCHTLNPVSYRQYCESRFSKLIGKPAIFDDENEEYALMRCKEHWIYRYPNESFENEIDSNFEWNHYPIVRNENLFNEIQKQTLVYSKFSWPYMSELVYLIASRQRYKGFLYILQRFTNGISRIVPTLDILLMLITHQSYPTIYAEDMKEIESEILGKVVGIWDSVKENEAEETKKVWEKAFDQPYEKAGGTIEFNGVGPFRTQVYWDVSDFDVNTKYKSLRPRFLLEVCVFVRLDSRTNVTQRDKKLNFLRLKVIRSHQEFKIDKQISGFSMDSWKKLSHLYCEFGTKGIMLDLRKPAGGCFRTSAVENSATFLWNDLLRAHSLTLERNINKQVRVIASITPPVQAPYLLKCVPDRVTDDSGAMISDVILRMNRYKPQEGRWLSRTVLDHAGKECFVVRIRVGGGFWRRGGETPSTVKWEDRIIEVREGSWSYVAGSIGRAPEKIVATATPKEPPENWEACWRFSSGEELLISLQTPSTSADGLRLSLVNQQSHDSTVKLLKGRKMQYGSKKTSKQPNEEEDKAEAEFATLVRYTEENPNGKATALLNWKLLIVEVLPEEDVVFVILLCISILRSVSEMRKEDVGSLLIRRRVKEAKLGARDWGSVIVHSCSPERSSSSSPYVEPWYWNPKALIASDGKANVTRQSASNSTGVSTANYSQVEGGDKLYKKGIIA